MAPWVLYYSKDDNKRIFRAKDKAKDKNVLSKQSKQYTKVGHICPLTGKSFKQRGKFWDYIKSNKLDVDNMTYDRGLNVGTDDADTDVDANKDNITKLLDITYIEYLWSNYFELNGDKKLLENLIGQINLELYIILLKVYKGDMDIDKVISEFTKESVTEVSVTEESVTEESVAEESVTEESVAEESVTEESVAEESVEKLVKEKLQDLVGKEYFSNNKQSNIGTDDKKIKVLDLFCGCGGFTKGLEDAGLNVVAGIDHWNPAVESYRKNFNHICLEKDLTTYTPEKFSDETGVKDIDILVGGPPCQGFSLAGKRDKKDPRNSLFMEYVKYLNYFKPKMFIMENVRGILSMKTSEGIYVKDLILNELNKEYECIPYALYARDFEVPQIRCRVLFIGIRKDLQKTPTQPEKINPDNHIPVSSILQPKEEVTEGYLSEKAITGIHNKKAKMKEKGFGFGAQFLNLDKPSYTIPARYHKDGYDALVKYSDTDIRKLTITELKRIQTFGDDFILHGNYKEQVMQIGNAVASRFAYHIGKYIINTLQ